jgi:hypothetical protein
MCALDVWTRFFPLSLSLPCDDIYSLVFFSSFRALKLKKPCETFIVQFSKKICRQKIIFASFYHGLQEKANKLKDNHACNMRLNLCGVADWIIDFGAEVVESD